MSRQRASTYATAALMVLAVSTTYGAGDVIPDDAVVLKVGDSVTLTFTQSGDSLVNPTVVKAPAPEGQPLIVLELTESGRARSFRILNGYDRVLRYRAAVRMRGRKRHSDVPVSEVNPGARSTMILNDPFDELALFEFSLSDSH
jgi:hypothetical protein